MIFVFWDRKNSKTVRSNELMETKVVEYYAAIDNEGYPPGTPVKELTDKYGDDCLVICEKIIGTLCYKTADCPSYCNWDMFCQPSDLVFLGIEGLQSQKK